VSSSGDLMRTILSFVRRLSDAVRLRSCCKAWRATLLDGDDAAAHLFAKVSVRFNRRVKDVTLRSTFASTLLRKLEVTGCAAVTDIGLSWLCVAATNLEELDISRCELVSNVGLEYVGWYCRALTSLDVSHLPLINDGEHQFHCPALRHFCCANTGIGNLCIETLAQRCLRLETVHAARTAVGARGLWALANHCTDLQQICLDECSNAYNPNDRLPEEGFADDHIRDDGLRFLAERCPRLEVVECAHAGDVGDAGVLALLDQCPFLRRVGLWGCAEVTAEAVAALQRRGVDVSHGLARTCQVAL
jgi:hypothetical protein